MVRGTARIHGRANSVAASVATFSGELSATRLGKSLRGGGGAFVPFKMNAYLVALQNPYQPHPKFRDPRILPKMFNLIQNGGILGKICCTHQKFSAFVNGTIGRGYVGGEALYSRGKTKHLGDCRGGLVVSGSQMSIASWFGCKTSSYWLVLRRAW